MLIPVKENNILIETNLFPHAEFGFEKFNPLQSQTFQVYDKDANCVIAAPTGSGKTYCCEMYIAHEIRQNKKKAIYVSPSKSLTQEKLDDWFEEDHHLSDLKTAICTGDYQATSDRKEELAAADLVLMTSEMLNSLCRNNSSAKNFFISEVGTLVIDEAHSIGSVGRGSHLEVGIINFVKINPNARIILLSATLPNVGEVGEWISKLTGKDTYLIKSEYRSVPLDMHFIQYDDKSSTLGKQGKYSLYEMKEMEKIEQGLSIIRKYPNDKMIWFVHSKKAGMKAQAALTKAKIINGYHNADLKKDARKKLEDNFSSPDGDIRVLVATSTLAAGVNLPARRVLVGGVHRGIDEVDVLDVLQMIGRAGRLKYDTKGDAYILVPRSEHKKWTNDIKNPPPIKSQIISDEGSLSHKKLAFHIVNEIYRGNILTRDDVEKWYLSTFANYQQQDLTDDFLDEMLDSLKKCGALIETDEKYEITPIGTISSIYYYSPYDVSDLVRNFNYLTKLDKNMKDDVLIAYSLANVDSNKGMFISKQEEEDIRSFMNQLSMKVNSGREISHKGIAKIAHQYYSILNGIDDDLPFNQTQKIKQDFDRLKQVVVSCDSMVGGWKIYKWLEQLSARMQYGVSWELTDICRIEGIGGVKAKKLWQGGIKTAFEVAKNKDKVKQILKCSQSVADKMCFSASEVAFKS